MKSWARIQNPVGFLLTSVPLAVPAAFTASKLRKQARAEGEIASANHVARSLKVRQTYTIGMMIPDVTNPFFADVMRGVEGEARRNNHSVIFCNADEDPELERRQLNMLFSRRVDGVLLAPTDSHAAQDRLINRRFPLVCFDRIPADFSGTAVVTDNFEASRQAARHLIGLGHPVLPSLPED